MRRHDTNPHVQKTACTVLWSLAANDDIKLLLVRLAVVAFGSELVPVEG